MKLNPIEDILNEKGYRISFMTLSKLLFTSPKTSLYLFRV